MILLLVTLGVLIAIIIARYNESNKLFWTLFTSFMVGIAGGHTYSQCNKTVSTSKKEICQHVSPTQHSSATANVTPAAEPATSTTVPAPVSKDTTHATTTKSSSESKVCVDTTTPPSDDNKNIKVCTDSLIRPDKDQFSTKNEKKNSGKRHK